METDTAPEKIDTSEPAEPGFYRYSGGNQNMIFLHVVSEGLNGFVDPTNKWYAIFSNGTMDECVWGYIEQALSVWELVPIKNDAVGARL